MKKLFLLLIFLIILNGCSVNNISKVCVKNNCFNIKLATNEEERTIGLMNRTFLNKDEGMLFIFDNEDYHSFWMKNMLFPLDILWINSENEVIFIKENALSCDEECNLITPNGRAKYVLEINSGLVKKYEIKLSDRVVLS